MELTIYKPSIYKGAGIYKTGAEGGGGGGGGSTETIDGDEYQVITAAGYLWMSQNYRKPEGAHNGNEYTKAAYMYPNDDIDNVEKYGLLYNYHAAKNIIDAHNGGESEWHVITRDEMNALMNYITANAGQQRSGYYLKSIDGWDAGNSSIDIIGFGAIGAGYMNESWHWPPEAKEFKKTGTYWTSTPYSSNTLYFRQFEYNSNDSSEGYNGQSIGYSIKLCKKL